MILLTSTQIPVSSSALVTELVALTSSLHQPLFHPSIVSLLATFSTSIAHFQVLELCSSGALVDFLKSRNPPTLVDSELRGVIKSMVDGLLYLKKESVVHGNINPSNLLLTSDGRIVSYPTLLDRIFLSAAIETIKLWLCSLSLILQSCHSTHS